MNRATFLFLLIITSMFFSVSCSPALKKTRLYDGEQLAPDQVGIIKNCQSNCKNYQIFVGNAELTQDNGPSEIELLPGTYELSFVYTPEIRFDLSKVELMPGKSFPNTMHYVPRTKVDSSSSVNQIFEIKTKKYITYLQYEVQAGKVYEIRCLLSRLTPLTGFHNQGDWEIEIVETETDIKCNNNQITHAFMDKEDFKSLALYYLFESYDLWYSLYNKKNSMGAGMYQDFINLHREEIYRRIPFTKTELEAIEHHSIPIGMSEDALILSWGYPVGRVIRDKKSGNYLTILNNPTNGFHVDWPNRSPEDGESIFLYYNKIHEGERLFSINDRFLSYVYLKDGKISHVQEVKNNNFKCDYQRTSASFRSRCGIGGVLIATYANRSTMVCSSNLRLNR